MAIEATEIETLHDLQEFVAAAEAKGADEWKPLDSTRTFQQETQRYTLTLSVKTDLPVAPQDAPA